MTQDTNTSAVEQNNDTKPADTQNAENSAVQGNDNPNSIPYARFNEVNKKYGSLQEEVKALKDYNKDRDHSLIDLAFKEYDLGALFVKDFYDASKSIALSVPTLLGSDWAQNEQKLMNQRNEYYKTMVAPELSGEYVLRTLGQQGPNVIMAIGTGALAKGLHWGDAAAKWAIAGTFGVT